MNNRWLIPVVGLSCLGVVAAIRLYSSSGEERIPARVYARPGATKSVGATVATSAGKAPCALRPAVDAGGNGHRATDDRHASVPRRSRRSSASLRERAARLAGRLDEAAVRWRNDLSACPEVWLLRGWLAAQTGEPEQALDCFDRVLAAYPGNALVLSAKAAVLVALRRYEEASSLYAEVIASAPRDAAARYNFGVLLYRQAKYAEAVEQFRELVRLQPEHARGQYNLATLAQREGRLSEARDAWMAFVRLESNVASAWFNLGVLWMDYEEPAQAAECFQRATTIDRQDATAWLDLAVAYAGAGHLQSALDAADEADELSPQDPAVIGCRAVLHEMLAREGNGNAQCHRDEAAALWAQIGR